jgi:hypothetical protein
MLHSIPLASVVIGCVLLGACHSKIEARKETAQPEPSASQFAQTANQDAASASEQLRFIDPVTGEEREPTAEELAQLSKSRSESQQKPSAPLRTTETQADGTVIMRYQEPPAQPLMGCVNTEKEIEIAHDCRPAQAE